MNASAQGQDTVQFNLAILQQQPQYKSLLRADQVVPANFPFLNEAEFGSLPAGIKTLWTAIASKPTDDPIHHNAFNKLKQITTSLLQRLQAYKASQASKQNGAQQGGQRPSSQGQSQQQPQQQQPLPSQQQQVQAQAPPQTQMQNQALPQAQMPQQQLQQQQQQQQHQQKQQQQTVQQARPPNQQLQAGQTATGQIQLTPDILAMIKHKLQSVEWQTPPNMAPVEQPQWRAEASRRYEQGLLEWEKLKAQIATLDGRTQLLKAQGRQIPEAWVESRVKWDQKAQQQQQFVAGLLQQFAKGGVQGRNPNASVPQNAIQSVRPGSAGGVQVKTEITGNTAVDAIRQQQQQQQTQPSSPAVPIQQQGHMAAQQQSHLGAQQGQPAQGTLAHPATVPQRPQPNPTQLHPHLPTPSTITPSHLQAGLPAPLSQQAAIAAAQRSYSNGLPQGLAQTSVGAGSNNRANMDKENGKQQWPMAKNWTPQVPQPVQMGAARPTLTGMNNGPMGMMGQPVIQKQPPFLLHGQGDRVLDKKKLDELVRQVTGGAGEGLHPDVEESVLMLADEFIDNVITSACKLAKLRGSGTLEIRDIQLVLERQYNIRVPGYATDEIRTVRKTQPAAGYLQKMNAVQAAKVMGGKTDI